MKASRVQRYLFGILPPLLIAGCGAGDPSGHVSSEEGDVSLTEQALTYPPWYVLDNVLVWQRDSGEVRMWNMGANGRVANSYSINPSPPAGYEVLAVAPFDAADRRVDLLVGGPNRSVEVWNLLGANVIGRSGVGTRPSDFAGHAKAIVRARETFHSQSGGSAILWNTTGITGNYRPNFSNTHWQPTFGPSGAVTYEPSMQIFENTGLWKLEGSGQFNSQTPGRVYLPDEVFRNQETGAVALRLNEEHANGIPEAHNWAPLDWQIAGLGDLNGDTTSDIVWRNRDTGDVAAWCMEENTVLLNGALGNVGPEWRIVGVGDVDQNNVADIIWRRNDGAVSIWRMAGCDSVAEYGQPIAVATDWKFVAVVQVKREQCCDPDAPVVPTPPPMPPMPMPPPANPFNPGPCNDAGEACCPFTTVASFFCHNDLECRGGACQQY